MSVLDQVRIVVYRFHEKGLEVFMSDDSCMVGGDENRMKEMDDNKAILLENVTDEAGNEIKVMAVEGDWHDIPSIRKMLKTDVQKVKGKIREIVPTMDQGVYVAVKEAIKKTMPHEYAALKELKDVLFDRNILRNL